MHFILGHVWMRQEHEEHHSLQADANVVAPSVMRVTPLRAAVIWGGPERMAVVTGGPLPQGKGGWQHSPF